MWRRGAARWGSARFALFRGRRRGGHVLDLAARWRRRSLRTRQRHASVHQIDDHQHRSPGLEAERPDLSQVSYGVIALGDRTYAATYCFGGKRFDALLQQLGAKRIGEPMPHDASAGTIPEEVAVEWIGPWLDQFREARDEAA